MDKNNYNPKNNRRRKKITHKTSNRNNCSSSSSNSNENSNNGSSSESNFQKSKLCCFGYLDYIVLSSAVAISLAEELDNTDLAILSTFFAVLSDELALITSVNACSSSDNDDVFIPPIPDVSGLALTSEHKKNNNIKNKTRIKKVIKKKIKKK